TIKSNPGRSQGLWARATVRFDERASSTATSSSEMWWGGDRRRVVMTIDGGHFPCTTTGFAEGPSSRALCRGSQLACAAIAWTDCSSNLFNGGDTLEHRFDASESGAEPVRLASRRPQVSFLRHAEEREHAQTPTFEFALPTRPLGQRRRSLELWQPKAARDTSQEQTHRS